MLKPERRIWIYLIGIALMFGVVILLGKEVVIPIIQNRGVIDLNVVNPAYRPQYSLDNSKQYIAKLNTNFGALTIQLYRESAPNNVNSFVYLAQKSYYNNTKFHRLIPNLLIQGGDKNTLDIDPTNDGKGKPNYLIDDEVNWESLNLPQSQIDKLKTAGYKSNPDVISHPLERFSVAMANAGPNTNGSQFFIVFADNSDSRLADLNGFYTVIGKVTDGFDVLNTISNIPVDSATAANPRPTQDIVIQSVDIVAQ